MLIKRMVLSHLCEVCPNLKPVLDSFVDNSYYEMQYGVTANGDRLRDQQEFDDDDCKSGHLLSFPITACNIFVFVFCFCFFFLQKPFVSLLEFPSRSGSPNQNSLF